MCFISLVDKVLYLLLRFSALTAGPLPVFIHSHLNVCFIDCFDLSTRKSIKFHATTIPLAVQLQMGYMA